MAQVAIITASDSGIGKECALLLAQQGFDIGITWHSDEEGAKDTAREVVSHGVRAEIVQLDLGNLPEGALALEKLICLLYTSPSPRDRQKSRMPSSA